MSAFCPQQRDLRLAVDPLGLDREAGHFDVLGLARLDAHPRRRGRPAEARQLVERNVAGTAGIGRIHHDQIERRARRADREHGRRSHFRALRAELGDIRLEHVQRSAILFDEQAGRCPARQRFQPSAYTCEDAILFSQCFLSLAHVYFAIELLDNMELLHCCKNLFSDSLLVTFSYPVLFP